MSSVYNYTFDNLTRIGNDKCGISEKDVQNKNFSKYQTQSYFAQDCGMRRPVDFATKQPNVFPTGTPTGTNVGLGGCNVDQDTQLKQGDIAPEIKSRISLQKRPFLTVPYLGKGPSKPVLESQLMQGSFDFDKKSCKNLMEKSFRNTSDDLVPSLKASIQNPANLIEDIAAEGWIRGGLPSRELSRDNDYFKRN